MTLITVGWCLQAQAQPTDFSLPPLPGSFPTANGSTGAAVPLPSSPIAPNAGAQKNTNTTIEASDAPAAFPELAGLPIPSAPAPIGAATTPPATTTTAATDTQIPATTPEAASPASPPMLPEVFAESTDTVAGEETTAPVLPAAPGGLVVAAPITTLPGLEFAPPPAPAGSKTKAMASTAIPATTVPTLDGEELPKFKMGGRTWNTKLAPVQQASTRGFNYRRQVLPDAIYRKSYDRDNRHLPVQVTRNDYSRLLIERVAANDINGTRALLNEGLSVNTVDGYGQSLLTVARRSGARDTERLLIARGAS